MNQRVKDLFFKQKSAKAKRLNKLGNMVTDLNYECLFFTFFSVFPYFKEIEANPFAFSREKKEEKVGKAGNASWLCD